MTLADHLDRICKVLGPSDITASHRLLVVTVSTVTVRDLAPDQNSLPLSRLTVLKQKDCNDGIMTVTMLY